MRLPPQVLRRRADGCRRSALFFSRIGDEGRAAHAASASFVQQARPLTAGLVPTASAHRVCPGRAARAGWFRRSGIFCGNARAIRLPARRRSGIKSPGSRPAQLLRTGARTLHRNTFGRRTRHALCAPEHDAAGAATIDQQHLPGGYPRRRKVLWRRSDQCELNIKRARHFRLISRSYSISTYGLPGWAGTRHRVLRHASKACRVPLPSTASSSAASFSGHQSEASHRRDGCVSLSSKSRLRPPNAPRSIQYGCGTGAHEGPPATIA